MGFWRVDNVLIVERCLCVILEIDNKVYCREEFVGILENG